MPYIFVGRVVESEMPPARRISVQWAVEEFLDGELSSQAEVALEMIVSWPGQGGGCYTRDGTNSGLYRAGHRYLVYAADSQERFGVQGPSRYKVRDGPYSFSLPLEMADPLEIAEDELKYLRAHLADRPPDEDSWTATTMFSLTRKLRDWRYCGWQRP